jgi:hypothetical protein
MIRQVFGEENKSHGKSKITVTEKGETSEEQSQELDDHFLDIRGIVHK